MIGPAPLRDDAVERRNTRTGAITRLYPQDGTEWVIGLSRSMIKWLASIKTTAVNAEDAADVTATFSDTPAISADVAVSDVQAVGDWFSLLADTVPASVAGSQVFLAGTHAERAIKPATAYGIGSRYYETDRTVTYVVIQDGTFSNVWQYEGGTYHDTLANIPGDLGAGDGGFLFHASDYSHTLQWGGAAWGWAPGDDGSGYYRLYEEPPAGFGGTSWQLCDGSTVDRLNADGTTTGVTVPDLSTDAYLKGGTTSAAIAAASGATASATTGATVDPHNVTQTSTAGADEWVFPTQADADHTVNDPGHSHGPGTLELRNLKKMLFYRR